MVSYFKCSHDAITSKQGLDSRYKERSFSSLNVIVVI